MVGIRFMPHTK